MRNFPNKISEIAPAQPRPPKSTIFTDHPHPTSWLKVVSNRGTGLGGVQCWKVKRDNKEFKKGKYKTKQREFNQVGCVVESLSIEKLLLFEDLIFGQKFVMCLPDRILIAPYDEGSRAVCPRFGWTRRKLQSAVTCAALTRDLYQCSIVFNPRTNNFTTKEVPL
ncbi:MAG: hypothetical protein JNL11_15060 [Bdellovibrionaceae bacterium]|nr:hypothetical protein [Pseudobdellovibrionaceae bacterium]